MRTLLTKSTVVQILCSQCQLVLPGSTAADLNPLRDRSARIGTACSSSRCFIT